MTQCPSCEVLYINGVRCHETGCPDAWKDEVRECKWCGTEFKPLLPGMECCSHSCEVAYSGDPCDCEECRADTVEEIS